MTNRFFFRTPCDNCRSKKVRCTFAKKGKAKSCAECRRIKKTCTGAVGGPAQGTSPKKTKAVKKRRVGETESGVAGGAAGGAAAGPSRTSPPRLTAAEKGKGKAARTTTAKEKAAEVPSGGEPSSLVPMSTEADVRLAEEMGSVEGAPEYLIGGGLTPVQLMRRMLTEMQMMRSEMAVMRENAQREREERDRIFTRYFQRVLREVENGSEEEEAEFTEGAESEYEEGGEQ